MIVPPQSVDDVVLLGCVVLFNGQFFVTHRVSLVGQWYSKVIDINLLAHKEVFFGVSKTKDKEKVFSVILRLQGLGQTLPTKVYAEDRDTMRPALGLDQTRSNLQSHPSIKSVMLTAVSTILIPVSTFVKGASLHLVDG